MMRISWFLALCWSVGAFAQQPKTPFNAAAFPESKYIVSRISERFGNASIDLIQVKPRIDVHDDKMSYCSAWVQVTRIDGSMEVIPFLDIEPVGASFGLSVLAQPLSPDFTAVLKFGDYDGRTLLIRSDGKVFNLPGGIMRIASDGRTLISEYFSDLQAITIFDLKSSKVIFEAEPTDGEIAKWYSLKNDLYFTTFAGDGKIKRSTGYFLKLLDRKLESQRLTRLQIQNFRLLPHSKLQGIGIAVLSQNRNLGVSVDYRLSHTHSAAGDVSAGGAGGHSAQSHRPRGNRGVLSFTEGLPQSHGLRRYRSRGAHQLRRA